MFTQLFETTIVANGDRRAVKFVFGSSWPDGQDYSTRITDVTRHGPRPSVVL